MLRMDDASHTYNCSDFEILMKIANEEAGMQVGLPAYTGVALGLPAYAGVSARLTPPFLYRLVSR
jgi:hypothetical protein